jgi:RecB family exonuclease
LLGVEADAWRRGVLAARQRVVFAVPRTAKGAAKSPHPLWDEISARLRLDDAATARLTRHVSSFLGDARGPELDSLVSTVEIAALSLPEGRGVWRVDPSSLEEDLAEAGTGAKALETLASCPLSWVLERRANLRSGAIAKMSRGPHLNGNLSHRLVEELFLAGAFDLEEEAYVAQSERSLNHLLVTEGATLLLPGAANERVQLTRQILGAMRGLYRYLRKAKFRIAAVEESVESDSPIGTLHGRLDVRLIDDAGKDAVLDLKWGASSSRALLNEGRAVQLAAYSRALRKRTARNSLPPAAYFAVGASKVLTTDVRMKAEREIDGPSLDETWMRVERTAQAVVQKLGRGEILVSGTRKALPLLDALGVAQADRAKFYESSGDAACKYCSFPAICGRAWESFQ